MIETVYYLSHEREAEHYLVDDFDPGEPVYKVETIGLSTLCQDKHVVQMPPEQRDGHEKEIENHK